MSTIENADRARGPEGAPLGKIRILFLGASPPEAPRVDLDRELREIATRLRVPEGTRLDLRRESAVRASDLQAVLLRHQPHVVHWSGHGELREGRAVLLVEDDAGGVAEIEPAAFGNLFRVLGGEVRVVVLNACHSAALAEAVVPHVACVVAMSADIGDRAAIAFAGAFYQAIAYGQSVRTAFEAGKNEIELGRLADVDVPKLLGRAGSSPEEIRLLSHEVEVLGPMSLAPSALPSGVARGDDPLPIHPRVDDLFVGRAAELARIHAALDAPADETGRERVCVLEGLPGSGKSYLADRFAHESRARFPGGYAELTLSAGEAPSAEEMGGRLAGSLRLPWGGPDAWEALRTRLRSPRTLLHLENVDAEPSAEAVAALLLRLSPPATIVSGRFRGLGEAAGWPRVDVRPLDDEVAVELLRREIARPLDRADLLRLARALGGLPLGLHLAAGHLAGTQTVDGFLRKLGRDMDSLRLRDPADPLHATDRARVMLSRTFELSLGLLASALGRRADALMPGLTALASLPASGFGVSLGVAVSGLSGDDFEDLVDAGVRLSLLTEVAEPRRCDRAFSMPTLLVDLLRARAAPDEAHLARATAWFTSRLAAAGDARREAWLAVDRERDALSAWLAELPVAVAVSVCRAAERFAVANGPYAAWLAFAERLVIAPTDTVTRSEALGMLCQVGYRAGALSRADDAARDKAAHDGARDEHRGAALALGVMADVRYARGDTREALRLLREEVLPTWDRVGDARERAVALRKVAFALRAQGSRAEAMRLLREEVLPALEKPEDACERAVALGGVALLLKARGELDEAARVLREEMLPVFERLGEERERAAALRKLAGILHVRGDLAEARRVLGDEVVPLLERLGDARERASANKLMAEILIQVGQPAEALRLLREDLVPSITRLGDARLLAFVYAHIAEALTALGKPKDALAVLDRDAAPLCATLDDPSALALVQRARASSAAALGQLDEAVRLLRDDVGPRYQRLGVTGQWAAALERAAGLLRDRGEGAEAARILRDEVAPYYDRTRNAGALGRVRALLGDAATTPTVATATTVATVKS